MPTFEYDFLYIQAALDQLESYLLSKDIYRPVGGNPPSGEAPYPQLTLGTLLLAIKRANAHTPDQKAELTKVLEQLEAIRSKWLSAWGRKASVEFRSRLNLWSEFLNEYRQHPESHHDRYAYEVSRRVMLQLLFPDTVALPSAAEQLLASLDNLLKAVMISGKFIWEDSLKTTFPENEYWYLYGYLPETLTQQKRSAD